MAQSSLLQGETRDMCIEMARKKSLPSLKVTAVHVMFALTATVDELCLLFMILNEITLDNLIGHLRYKGYDVFLSAFSINYACSFKQPKTFQNGHCRMSVHLNWICQTSTTVSEKNNLILRQRQSASKLIAWVVDHVFWNH